MSPNGLPHINFLQRIPDADHVNFFQNFTFWFTIETTTKKKYYHLLSICFTLLQTTTFTSNKIIENCRNGQLKNVDMTLINK